MGSEKSRSRKKLLSPRKVLRLSLFHNLEVTGAGSAWPTVTVPAVAKQTEDTLKGPARRAPIGRSRTYGASRCEHPGGSSALAGDPSPWRRSGSTERQTSPPRHVLNCSQQCQPRRLSDTLLPSGVCPQPRPRWDAPPGPPVSRPSSRPQMVGLQEGQRWPCPPRADTWGGRRRPGGVGLELQLLTVSKPQEREAAEKILPSQNEK